MSSNVQKRFYPLTDPQKRIWYTESIYSNSSMWNIGGALRVQKNLHFEMIEEAFNILVKRYEVFRLGFKNNEGDIYQYIKDYKKIIIHRHSFSNFEEFKNWADNDFKSVLSIGKEDLFYFSFCDVNERETILYLKMHHIISDGWSFALIAKELCEIYNHLIDGNEAIDCDKNSYLDFIKNEEEYLSSIRFKRDKEYWNEKFKNLPEHLYSEKDHKTDAIRKLFKLDKNLSLEIQRFIKNAGCSLNTFFITVYLIYLFKMFDQEDIVIGNPNFNRTSRKERKTAGMFTSTMPFRYKVHKEIAIYELITDVNKELITCFKHQKYPYNLLIQDLKLNQSGYDSLFNVCINYYNSDFNILLNEETVEIMEFNNGHQAYPLQIVIKEWGERGEIELAFDYKVGMHSEENIEITYEYMINIIKSILENPKMKINNIKLISKEEIEFLEVDFNSTESHYPHNKTIIQLFEEQVEKTPYNIALRFNDFELTYEELNAKSNQLAKRLREKGVEREAKVAIMANHSWEMVAAILAIIKAGGAYVPIDGNYPVERINYMIKDSGVSLILTNYDVNPEISFEGDYINLNDSDLYTGVNSNLNIFLSPQNLVYMIYTSGSTGRPKGVMIEHRGLVNYSWWAKKVYIQSQEESFALYSSLSFDLTVTSIFAPIINGNRIEIYYDDGSEFVLYKILKENKVNIIKLTPAHLSLLKDMDNKSSSVKRFIVGGENLKVNLAASIHESFGGNIEIFNEYGPTETVVGCMIHKYDCCKDIFSSVPIGVPADNVQVYILDDYLNIVPYGKVGELYIGGDGVARGYLNQEELTKDRFVKNPFIEGQVMYKTGDTAIYKKDGTIEYIGRKDNQVKIRGHRIELEEIENHLLSFKNITEAVVIDRKDKKGDKRLYAYIVSIEEMQSYELKKNLSKILPNYMVPSHFVFLDKIPLTPNGKINTKILPEPKDLNIIRSNIEGPRDVSEETLINIMKEVLNIDEISITDNFYELGGDSIKAIQIANKLSNIGISIKVKDILSSDAIGEIAAALQFEENVQASQTFCEGTVGNTPITSWFFEQKFEKFNHWNQSVLLKLNNSITREMIEKGINELIKHHDSLRINYNVNVGNLYFNSLHLESFKEVLEFNLSEFSEEEQKLQLNEAGERFKCSFDLERDVLFKACIFNLGKGEKRLLITAHHLVVDGVSWRIILEDLNSLLQGQLKGETVILPRKTHSVQLWVKELEKHSHMYSLKEQEYWNEVLASKFSIPTDYAVEESLMECETTLKAELTFEETEMIQSEVNRAYGTEFSEILTIALSLALSEYFKQDKVTLELEGHGREEISENIDISRTVGWFTSMYPVNLSSEGSNFNEKIKSLKEQLRKVPGKGFNYGVLKYMNKAVNDIDNKYIRFNYLGDFDSTFNNALFESVYEASGVEQARENHMTSLIEVVSMIIGRKLTISISFSKKTFKEETIKRLLDEYLFQLREVIHYCSQKNCIEFTPSDFDTAEISQEDLDSLFG